MEEKNIHCPNCSAPISAPVGEVELICEFCESKLKFIPDTSEMEVVKTREEMKYKERVEVRKLVLQKQLQQEEAEAWRKTAADVALKALPIVGTSVGRGLFRAALGRSAGCLGCGCLVPVAVVVMIAIALFAAR